MERVEARAGDPLVNDDLLELRWRHRRRLRLMRDWIIAEVFQSGFFPAQQPVYPEDATRRRVTEWALRHVARELEEKNPSLRKLLNDLATGEYLWALDAFLSQNWHHPPDGGPHPLEPFAEKARANSAFQHALRDEDDADALTAYLMCAIWADWLADDGYVDPRVRHALEQSTST